MKFDWQGQESFRSPDTHRSAADERHDPLAKACITPLCTYNMENTGCILNF